MRSIDLSVKIIPSTRRRRIGWKGEVLEIELDEVDISSLISFLSDYLGVAKGAISIERKDVTKNIYDIIIRTKHIEDPRILFVADV